MTDVWFDGSSSRFDFDLYRIDVLVLASRVLVRVRAVVSHHITPSADPCCGWRHAISVFSFFSSSFFVRLLPPLSSLPTIALNPSAQRQRGGRRFSTPASLGSSSPSRHPIPTSFTSSGRRRYHSSSSPRAPTAADNANHGFKDESSCVNLLRKIEAKGGPVAHHRDNEIAAVHGHGLGKWRWFERHRRAPS